MFVIVTYDVNMSSVSGIKRLRNVARSCMNYGKRVQNSVFECVLNESQFIKLREALAEIIDQENDSIRFYLLGSNWEHKVVTLGKNKGINFSGELII